MVMLPEKRLSRREWLTCSSLLTTEFEKTSPPDERALPLKRRPSAPALLSIDVAGLLSTPPQAIPDPAVATTAAPVISSSSDGAVTVKGCEACAALLRSEAPGRCCGGGCCCCCCSCGG